jgi:hypothetical protein
MTIRLRPRNAVVLFAAIIGCLFLADAGTLFARYSFGHDYLFGFVPLFDLDQEQNVPTYFATAQLLICAGLAFVIGFAERRCGGRDYRYWIGLGFMCLFMSLDEMVGIHERIVNPIIRPFSGASGPREPFYISWVIPYSALVAVLGLVYLPFVRRVPARIRRLAIVSAILYVTGALLAVLIAGYCFESRSNWGKDLTYGLNALFAETLEMVGILILFYALMTYIDQYLPDLGLRITSSSSE